MHKCQNVFVSKCVCVCRNVFVCVHKHMDFVCVHALATSRRAHRIPLPTESPCPLQHGYTALDRQERGGQGSAARARSQAFALL